MALQTFSLSNDIVEVSPQDEIYKYDAAADRQINNQSPWATDPHYFKSCRISAVALIKMVIHARSGVPHEIMGLMQGKVVGQSLVIMDSFALPVQGTETRVNAANEANEYMVEYLESSKKVGRLENAIGWYHSHPGYGCWLSGIDVNTQMTNQRYQDPFVAVVIDPNRTISAGKVDIGAFRTYPEDYKPPTSGKTDEYQSIPLSKIEDFGVHANSYYPLDVQIFKSTLDDTLLGLLWNKYWVNTLSQSPLISNRAYAVSQLQDLQAKLNKAKGSIPNTRASVPTAKATAPAGDSKAPPKRKDTTEEASTSKAKDEPKESALQKGVRDSTKLAMEAQHGLISQALKEYIFGANQDVAQSLNVLNTAIATEK
ncbi:probable COP9 signalosome subunit 5 CSN5 [Serendipita indica DSM 11827]|uniref:COP9 signalosome complex subunit 5 n=1 Tax=Serendipita indica (strain DSM 11827) TaxID=1109443 RepID=G4TL52_SERID|nr:probable COP9 signalosome subunit 5 CSN5 [Serendipita indica DSM 11827]